MTLPCMRPDSPRDIDLSDPDEMSDEAAFLRAVGIASARGFDWLSILPENRGRWARRVLAWEAKEKER